MYAFSFEKFIEAFLPILSKLGSTMFLTVGTFVIAGNVRGQRQETRFPV